LDYDDFNSRHQRLYMQMVLEELGEYTCYDGKLLSNLTRSLSNSYITVTGEIVGQLVDTLMSGHRGTSVFNTILNPAYIMVAFPSLRSMASLHVGDDVYVLAQDYTQAYALLRACKETGLALNPIKQSIGIFTAEFLRMAYTETKCFGYGLRSVGTCVEGNWVGEMRLNAEDGLKCIVGHAWTLVNRCGRADIVNALVPAVTRISGLKKTVVAELLSGRAALGDGPCRVLGPTAKIYDVSYDHGERSKALAQAAMGLGDAATIDYMTHHATPHEQYVFGKLGVDIVSLMKVSSYTKTLVGAGYGDDPSFCKPTSVKVRKLKFLSTQTAESLVAARRDPGVLHNQTLLQLVKNAISDELLSDVVMSLTGEHYTGEELKIVAWGRESRAVGMCSCFTYADAGKLCGVASADMVHSVYSCFA